MRQIFSHIRELPHLLTQAVGAKAAILVYHRVGEKVSDPWSLAVTTQHFSQHLEVLRHYYHPMPMNELLRRLHNGSLPHRSVAITFDDGYADIFHNALPALKHYMLDATVFLTSAFIGSGREFWWDELDRIFLQPGVLPQKLHLEIDGKAHVWDLGSSARYRTEDAYQDRAWVAPEESPTARQLIYRSLWELLHVLSHEKRLETLDRLFAWAEVKPVARPSHRILSKEEVLHLLQTGLIEPGAHSVTHTSLSSLPTEDQREEICTSKAQIEELLGCQVTGFAYPYGRHGDYTRETISLVQEAGFVYACSNFSGLIYRSTDTFQLPRLYIKDMDGEMFCEFLSRWFHPLQGLLRR